MRLASVRVENFRGVVKATLSMDDLTALIGPNGSGKTTLLLAIERFFSDERKRMVAADFNDCSKPLEITAVVEDVKGGSREVTCEWNHDPEKNSVPAPRYTCEGETATKYSKFVPTVDVVYIPAEHETDDDGEDKRNTLWERVSNIIRGRIMLDEEVDTLHKKIRDRHGEYLEDIERRINETLSDEDGVGFAPSTKVSMRFEVPAVKPGVDLRVRDLDSSKDVDHKYAGHGTKRAFYMSALWVISEVLAEGAKGGKTPKAPPNRPVIIAIDEPELHQHPQRQRVLRDALRGMSERDSCQVVYATHSPHFVRLKEPMTVRKVAREPGGTKIYKGAGLAEAQVRGAVVSAMEEAAFANGVILVEGYTDEVILGAICRKAPHEMTRRVTREGKEATETTTETVMATLIKSEVAIVGCGGKANVVRFCDVLDSLGIKKFVMWDGDSHHKTGKKKKDTRESNLEIATRLKLDPKFAERVEESGGDKYVRGDRCACFGHDVPAYFGDCFGMHGQGLKEIILDGADIEGRFARDVFEKTAFSREMIPAILESFAKEGVTVNAVGRQPSA